MMLITIDFKWMISEIFIDLLLLFIYLKRKEQNLYNLFVYKILLMFYVFCIIMTSSLFACFKVYIIYCVYFMAPSTEGKNVVYIII
jgi:hypothetical protein